MTSAANKAASEVSYDLPLQPASKDIWQTKYQLKDKAGVAIDLDVDDTYKRVAKALANVEEHNKEKWEGEFLWALRNGCVPAGRITSNAGAGEHKPSTSTINCTVSSIIEDSMHGILSGVYESGITLAAGCGIGYEFSTLRPRGAFVAGVGATTSGALSFMDIYDRMCSTVSSAGGRRGAQMGTLDVSHPDVFDFIKAKREDGRLRHFNLSLLITDGFIETVKRNGDWQLVFPINKKEADLYPETEWVWKAWPYVGNNMVHNAQTGLVACRVYSTVKAKELWDTIMQSTYNYAEPGFILVDRVNADNNNWFCEEIRATNPCGEQGLPPYGACLLGSVNLTKFVIDPFKPVARFDWTKYNKAVAVFTRMLDNVVEINGLPLEKQREEIFRKRRHGMGYFGLGSALAMMNMAYGSERSIEFTDRVTQELAVTGWAVGVQLAKEKGPAPIFNEVFMETPKIASRLAQQGGVVYASYKAAELFVNSNYMKKIFKVVPDLRDDILKYGCRFTHHSSIAPTGTIALSVGNNASNGIEPSFAHEYNRNVIREGHATKQAVTVRSYEALLWSTLHPQLPYPEHFSDSETIKPKDHVNVQAAAQYWIDSAISKTVNVPSDFPFEEFKDVYMYAHAAGLKGCTTFRFNPQAFQGVLVTDKNLEDTMYTFVLEDGTEISLKGNEEVEYNGQTHTAANLFDALKEGYYGKL